MPTFTLTPATGDGVTTVFTANALVRDEEIRVDRLPQTPVTDYTSAEVGGVSQYTFAVAPVVGAAMLLIGNQLVSTSSGVVFSATVQDVINDAAVELGLIKTDGTDPFASTDPNILQLLRLLKSGGADIIRHREWTFLVKEYTFNLVGGQSAYALPSDFRSIVADSEWDRSTRFPLEMPISSQDWQFLKAVPIASNIIYYGRLWNSQIQVVPTPGALVTDTMAFEYNSKAWLAPTGFTTPTLTAPAAGTDIVCLPDRLVVARLKRDWRRNKKQDSQSEEEDYQTALFDAENEDTIAKTIYLGGRRSRWQHRKLDRWNLPDVIR